MDPMLAILKAQQANIARMEPGLILDGTDGRGNQVEVQAQRPAVIRLYDHPLRLSEETLLENWTCLVTLVPINDESVVRAAARDDRRLTYQVQFLMRLLDSEMAADRAQVRTGGIAPNNPLAQRVHDTMYAWHHLFHDNLHLITDECPTGLVDDAGYTRQWEEVSYPLSLVTATVRCDASGW